jgi:hypothetical protein
MKKTLNKLEYLEDEVTGGEQAQMLTPEYK